MAQRMLFPKQLYVTVERENDGTVYFSASRTAFDAAPDEGTVALVGVYTLTGKKRVKKLVDMTDA